MRKAGPSGPALPRTAAKQFKAKVDNPITRDAVQGFMLDAESHDGQITASKAWQPRRDKPVNEGFVDEGRVTSSPEWVIRKARRLGIPPEVDREFTTFDFGPTTCSEHEQLRDAIGVETDAEFWSRTRSRRPRGDSLALTLACAA